MSVFSDDVLRSVGSVGRVRKAGLLMAVPVVHAALLGAVPLARRSCPRIADVHRASEQDPSKL